MTSFNLKQQAALAACDYLEPDMVLGVGTGSTTDAFIELIADKKHWFQAVVSSSESTTSKLKACGIDVVSPNSVMIDLYVDGADEIDLHLQLIKGGGAAHTREKILAASAKKFIVIADASKKVERLGDQHPLPIEVHPMARSFVARKIVALGGEPVYREGVVTDNGNEVIDVYQLNMTDPVTIDHQINQIPGVIAHGLFPRGLCDLALIASDQGIERMQKQQMSFDFS